MDEKDEDGYFVHTLENTAHAIFVLNQGGNGEIKTADLPAPVYYIYLELWRLLVSRWTFTRYTPIVFFNFIYFHFF